MFAPDVPAQVPPVLAENAPDGALAEALARAAAAEARLARLGARVERERRARAEAESLAERGLRDLYERQREVELLAAVSAAANSARSAEEVLEFALERVCAHTGWPLGHVLVREVPDEEEAVYAGPGPWLVSTGRWHGAAPRHAALRATSARTRFAPGVGLPGRVLASGAPAWAEDLSAAPCLPREGAAVAAGLRSGFAVPVLVGDEVGAVLEFYTELSAPPDEGLLALAASVGTQLGRVFERGRAEAAVRASGAQLRAVFDHAAVGIALHDSEGWILEANRAYQQLLGYTRDELLTMRASQLSPPDDLDVIREPLRALKARQCDRVMVEKRLVRKDGAVRTYALTVSRLEATGQDAGLVAMLQDVTDHRALQEELVYRAYHDPLTALANRARLRERAAAALGASGERADRVAVLVLDLDGFKLVNDSAGHTVGDALLVQVAARLLHATRGSDLVARLGGDEFAVLLDDVGGDADATRVADRIVESLGRPFTVQGTTAVVGVSVGIARGGLADLAPSDGTASLEPVDALLRDADLALYAAKARGKGQAVVFERAMHASAVERVALEAAMRRGLDCGEFFLVYQPIVHLGTGALAGVESLVRWRTPERGVVSPAQFIPLAEETGLIRPLGRWVLEEACRQGAAWIAAAPDAPAFSVTANVSGRQLQQPGFVAEVEAALAESGFPAERLVVELTESTVVHHPDVARRRLTALKALGVRVAIDDFGTGYSALSYLRQFPIDVLKIDKSFVDEIAGGGQPAALAAAIVALGDALSLRTVAEGVETAEQAAALGRMGCALGQGYHFSRPVHPEAIAAGWIRPG